MRIDYTVQIWKEGNQYIAHTMPLDVMSSGFTPEEAENALKEAVHIFIQTAKDMGTLEDIMENLMIHSDMRTVVADLAIQLQNIRINKMNTWDSLIQSLDKFSDDFMLSREQPPLEDREAMKFSRVPDLKVENWVEI